MKRLSATFGVTHGTISNWLTAWKTGGLWPYAINPDKAVKPYYNPRTYPSLKSKYSRIPNNSKWYAMN